MGFVMGFTMGVSNDWFKSYISNCSQYVSINGWLWSCCYKLRWPSQICPRSMLFLLHINYLNQAIKFCNVHQFADDTNLLCLSKSIKKTEQTSQCWLKASSWLVKCKQNFTQYKKTKIVIFKSKQNKFEGDLKIKPSGKKLYPIESVKYLAVKTDANLSWQYRVEDLSIKLNRANALHFKMRKYVSHKILRFISFANFDSYLSYCCLVWGSVL